MQSDVEVFPDLNNLLSEYKTMFTHRHETQNLSFKPTLTALLNLLQKSWKMRKHSSSLKVSLSSQKKSMRVFPSLRRSSLRLFRSWSVRAELWDIRHTVLIYIMLHTYMGVIICSTWVSSSRNVHWPGSNFLYVCVYDVLHNGGCVTCRKGSSCCSSSWSPWTFSSRVLIRTYKEENSISMFSTEILHENSTATRKCA